MRLNRFTWDRIGILLLARILTDQKVRDLKWVIILGFDLKSKVCTGGKLWAYFKSVKQELNRVFLDFCNEIDSTERWSFRDLVERMTELNQIRRVDLDQLVMHPFYKAVEREFEGLG
jgi:hypothetical protein